MFDDKMLNMTYILDGFDFDAMHDVNLSDIIDSFTNGSTEIVCEDNRRDINTRALEWTRFFIEGVANTAIGTTGILGNLLAILILCMAREKTTFTHLILMLSCVDTLYLAISLLDYSLIQNFGWPIQSTSFYYMKYFPTMIFPFSNIFLSIGTNVTVAISLERYLAVCKPLTFHRMAKTKSCLRRFLWYAIPSILFSIGINIPKFFETSFIHQTDVIKNLSQGLNFSVDMTGEGIVVLTSLRRSEHYNIIYLNFIRGIFTAVLPVIALFVFNVLINNGIRYTHVRSRAARREANQARTLVMLVAFYLVCNFPRLLLDFLEQFYIKKECHTFKLPPWFDICTSVSHLLLTINCSVNLAIYTIYTPQFRSGLAKINLSRRNNTRNQAVCPNQQETIELCPVNTVTTTVAKI